MNLLPAPRIAGLLPAPQVIEQETDPFPEKRITITVPGGLQLKTNGEETRDIGLALAELTQIARRQLDLPLAG